MRSRLILNFRRLSMQPNIAIVRCSRCGVLERAHIHTCKPETVERFEREKSRGPLTAANAKD